MNEMLQRIGDVAVKGGPYVWRAKLTACDKYAYEIWTRDDPGNLIRWVKTVFNNDEAYNLVQNLNKEFVARAIVEIMRNAPNCSEIYSAYRCDKIWNSLSSKEVWQLWIDAILKE